MTNPIEREIDVCLSVKENHYWKLVVIAAQNQHTIEDWLDKYLSELVEQLIEKNEV
jgi:hypothetical protein